MAPTSYKRLTIFLAGIVLLSNLGALHLYAQLPEDPLHLAWHLSLYSCFAIVLAVVGLVGARRDNATLVSIFSNFLLIDTMVSTIPRVVAVTLFPTIRSSICSAENIKAWLDTQARSIPPSLAENVESQMVGECRNIVGVLQILAGMFVVSITVLQMLLSLRVCAYARALCRTEDELQDWACISSSPPPYMQQEDGYSPWYLNEKEKSGGLV